MRWSGTVSGKVCAALSLPLKLLLTGSRRPFIVVRPIADALVIRFHEGLVCWPLLPCALDSGLRDRCHSGVGRQLLQAAAMHAAPRQAPFGCARRVAIVVFALGVVVQPRSAGHSLHATARKYTSTF